MFAFVPAENNMTLLIPALQIFMLVDSLELFFCNRLFGDVAEYLTSLSESDSV